MREFQISIQYYLLANNGILPLDKLVVVKSKGSHITLRNPVLTSFPYEYDGEERFIDGVEGESWSGEKVQASLIETDIILELEYLKEK